MSAISSYRAVPDPEDEFGIYSGKPLLQQRRSTSRAINNRVRSSSCSEASETFSYKAVDKSLRYNYIFEGYRREPSLRASLCSLFTLHNETVNIWSHFGSFLVTLYLLLSLTFGPDGRALSEKGMQHEDLVILCIYYCGCMTMFGFSASYHLFRDTSVAMDRAMLRLDHLGIVVQILVSFISTLYFCFAADLDFNRTGRGTGTIAGIGIVSVSTGSEGWLWFEVYATGISLLCLGAGLVLSLPHCSQRFAFLRSPCAYAITFGSIIAFCVVPFTHLLLSKGSDSPEFLLCYGYFTMLFFYTFGCVVYLLKIPECFFPGCFDLMGSSHNLFHIFIVFAAAAHGHTNFRFLDLRNTQRHIHAMKTLGTY